MLLLALALMAAAIGVFVSSACLLAYLEWRVLRKIPHLESSSHSIKGSMELLADNDKVAHALHAAAERLGTGIFAFRVFHINTVVVTDASLVHQALSLPKAGAPSGRVVRRPALRLSCVSPPDGSSPVRTRHRQVARPRIRCYALRIAPAAAVLVQNRNIYRIFNMLTSPDGRQPNLLGHLSHGGYWKLVRKGVAPAFAPRHIRAEFPHLLAVVDRLSAVLTAIGPEHFVDVDNALQRESMDVIGRVGFGHDFSAIEGFAGGAAQGTASAASKIAAGAFESLRGSAHEVTLLWNTPFRMRLRRVLPSARRGAACMATLQAHMRGMLQVVRARGPPAADDMSIAAHLLRIRDPATGKGLTDEQLAGEMGLFLFAGFETTGEEGTAFWQSACSAHFSLCVCGWVGGWGGGGLYGGGQGLNLVLPLKQNKKDAAWGLG
jgi:cytochrome P450